MKMTVFCKVVGSLTIPPGTTITLLVGKRCQRSDGGENPVCSTNTRNVLAGSLPEGRLELDQLLDYGVSDRFVEIESDVKGHVPK